nr:hypothetical protein [uncultured Sphingomonas sp.]
MKTHRMSKSTENRNARKAIAFRGGGSGLSAPLSQSQHVLSGRRLRRAARSAARLQAFVVPEEGAPRRPTVAVDVDPYTRAVLGGRII